MRDGGGVAPDLAAAYNAARPRRIVVEIVTEQLPSVGAMPARLEHLGVAVIGNP